MMNKLFTYLKMAFICAIVAIPLAGCGTKSVSVNDYYEYEITGYNGQAHVEEKLNWSELESAVLAASKYDENDAESMSVLAATDMAVKKSWSKDTDLSNGDEIVLTWTIDNSGLKNAKVKLVAEDIKIKVSGLSDIATFDPFEYLDLKTSGASPTGSVEFWYYDTDPAMNDISFSSEKVTGLSNGDIITVKANTKISMDAFAEKYNEIPSVTEKEIEIKGLPEYVQSIDQIPENVINNMNNKAVENIKSQIGSSWANPENLAGIEYAGMLLLTGNNDNYSDTYNYLVIVDKVSVSGNDPFEYYYTTTFKNGMIQRDGSFSIDLSDYVPCGGSGFLFTSGAGFYRNNLRYTGYDSLDSIKKGISENYGIGYDVKSSF